MAVGGNTRFKEASKDTIKDNRTLEKIRFRKIRTIQGKSDVD